MRICKNRDCQAPLPHAAHHRAEYCSASCKKKGCYSAFDSTLTIDPIAVINQSAVTRRAAFVRFSYRRPGTAKWWYFPVDACQIPLVALPPLPEPGDYRVLFYDEQMNLLPSDEMAIRLPLSAIKQTCKLTAGSRAIKSWL